MKQRTQYHLILDRADPGNPRWVIAKECASKPAQVPDDLDANPHHPRPTQWLGEFSYREFHWMEMLFGRETALRMTQRGEESFSTPISHHTSPWTEYHVPVYADDTRDDAPYDPKG